MRKAIVLVNKIEAGVFEEIGEGSYRLVYNNDYQGPPISLTLPVKNKSYEFKTFPPFFEGLLPEGALLEGMLRKCKLDKNDYFGQLLQVGHDVVGAVTVKEVL